jgi:Uma2 family endonuclease
LGIEVGGPFDRGRGGPGGWWILDEPEIHLGSDILVPDLAGWRLDLHPEIKGRKKYHVIAPEWICEVLYPSTAGVDRVKKLPIYVREKVDHVWLIHPIEKTLEIYQRSESRWILLNTFAGEGLIRAVPYDAVEIDLGSLWLPE